MRFVNCHIENFGKLQDVSVDLTSGLNYFCKENGWGKSTLAAFVRVMLYGFMGEGKRTAPENERKRYAPWQGGVYGGSLTFETGGKTYTVTRVFRDKAANDTFELRDARTNLESNDFSANLGEELFKINAESFMRTAFVGQQDCVTATTDSINAKIGNLTDNTNDLNSYEVADEALKDLLNKFSPRMKKGAIYQMNEEITRLRKVVSDGATIDGAIEELQGYCDRDRVLLEEIRDKKTALSKEQERVSALQDALGKKETYDHLCKDLEDKKAELDDAGKKFPKEAPPEAEVQESVEVCATLEHYRTELNHNRFSETEAEEFERLQRAFQQGTPDGELLKQRLSDAKELEEIHQKDLYHLQQVWNEYSLLKSTLNMQKANLSVWKEQAAAQRAAEAAQRAAEMAQRMAEEKQRMAEAERQAAEAEKQAAVEKQRMHALRRTAAGLMVVAVALVIAGVILTNALFYAGAAIAAVAGLVVLAGTFKGRKMEEAAQSVAEGGSVSECGMPVDDEMLADGEMLLGSERKADGEVKADSEVMATNESEIPLEREIRGNEQELKQLEVLLTEYMESHALTIAEADVIYYLQEKLNRKLIFEDLTQKYCKVRVGISTEEVEKKAKQLLELAGRYGEIFLGEISTTQGAAKAGIREWNPAEFVAILMEKTEKVFTYKQKDERNNTTTEAYNQCKLQISNFLTRYGYPVYEDALLRGQVQEILQDVTRYQPIAENYKRALFAKESYEKEHNLQAILEMISDAEQVSLQELQEQYAVLEEEGESVRGRVRQYEEQLSELQERYDEWNSTKEILEEKENEYKEYKTKYSYLEKTRTYLGTAKESLTARYMGPIMNQFVRYYGIVTGSDAAGYHMDANANVTKKEQGMQRATIFLSAGYQDLVGVCLRLALIEAMYEHDKPVLIMDDPFVNLDIDNSAGAKRLLDELAKEYQIIYFTCK